MSGDRREEKSGRRLVFGCFGIALVIAAALVLYIVLGHWASVGPYEGPPVARP